MDSKFSVERVALHLVDKQLPELRFSEQDVDLKAFKKKNPQDAQALQRFFSGHLDKVWDASEGVSTLAASFKEPAKMRLDYDEIIEHPSRFFSRSCDMAQRLYDISPKNASRGLLMVLWFRANGDDRTFLGLVKMDPGPSDKIALRLDKAGHVLLDLAIQHFEQALPDQGNQVYKWAVIPHPTRRTFGVKLKDYQSGSDPAQYFLKFLGCEPKPKPKAQVFALLETLPTYAQEHHAKEDWKTGVGQVVKQLEKTPRLTPQVVAETIQELDAFEGFQKKAFLETLAKSEARELDASDDALRTFKLRYTLPSRISIQGPRAAMESLVRIVPVDGGKGVEFRIRTPDYDKSYV